MLLKSFSLSFSIIVQCIVILFTFPTLSIAQEVKVENVENHSIEINRIVIVDLDGILRAADANKRVRELLDEQKAKFQEEFRSVEIDLQKSERDLATKRESMDEEEYEKLVNVFQVRVSNVQKEIQYKRQSIDRAYQKALSDIRSLAVKEITKIASERKIDLVLKRDSSVIFLPHLNISDEVLKRLNERTKNARIKVEIKKSNVK